jgi:serine/threonine-protein kinase SRPK3
MMDGVDLTKAVLNKGKQMASVATAAANGNGGKKRRKGTDLKPIVTNDAANPGAEPAPAPSEGCVFFPLSPFASVPLTHRFLSQRLAIAFPFDILRR